MKRNIYLIAVILILFTGCNETKENLDATDVENSTINQGEVTQDYENDFIDFSQKENWGTAYYYIEMLYKPVKETLDDYQNWEFQDTYEGSMYYENPEKRFGVFIHQQKDLSYYRENKTLLGDEICLGIATKMDCLFPNSKWPSDVQETDEYLKSYLGFNAELIPDGEDVGYGVYIYLKQNGCKIIIWSESEIITPESYVRIFGYESFIEEQM